MRRIGILIAAVAAVWLAKALAADDYPSKPVTIVVPFPAGGSSDILARFEAEALQRELGKPFIVENRTGAGGVIAAAAVAKSAPDGYTVLHANSAFAVAPYTAKISYDPDGDFDAISICAITNFVLVVNPGLGIGSVRELIARAKEKPNELTYGSAGVGSVTHLFAELFDSTAGVKLRHIPYRGTAPALVDVMSGQISMYISEIPSALGLIREGKLKALGVTSLTRDLELPDLPTVAETLPGFEAVGWQGLLIRAGTSRDIVDKLNKALDVSLRRPETPAKFKAMGFGMKLSTPGQSRAFVRQQLTLFKKVVTEAGIVPQ